MPSPGGERQFGRHFRRQFGGRVIASQKLSRDSGETIFAPGHQDVSQGPLGLPQNSVSSLFRNSTLETVFRPFPSKGSADSQPKAFGPKGPRGTKNTKTLRVANHYRDSNSLPR